jgi:2-desacetyl-2-hydroxyethyl bacteriochlorophyllide A dehydrogenase
MASEHGLGAQDIKDAISPSRSSTTDQKWLNFRSTGAADGRHYDWKMFMRLEMMNSITCDSPGVLHATDREITTPAHDEVLIRVARVGVCGTDFHIFQGKHPFLSYPIVMGHELAGAVVDAGLGARQLIGERVSVIPYISCGNCVACRNLKPNCCQKIRVLGVHCDGGLSEYITVPAANVFLVRDLAFDQAAMIEFLAIGGHGVSRAVPHVGDRVLVVGAGPIGLSAMIFSALKGCEVTAADLRPERLEFCRNVLSVRNALEVDQEIGDKLRDLTNGDFFDLVIDATGNRIAMESNLEYVAHGGTYLLLGVNRELLSFPDPELHKRETSLLASRNATRADFDDVLLAIQSGKIPTKALLSHRAPLNSVPKVFDTWINPAAGVIKAMIDVADL